MVVSNPASQQGMAGKRKVETTAKQEQNGSSSGKCQKVNSVPELEQQMPPVLYVLQPGAVTQISSRMVSQQTGNRVVTTTPFQCEYSRNNTA